MNHFVVEDKNYTIRSLKVDDSMSEITELLHRAYAGLAAQGLRFMATHQDVTVTRERMNGELSYVVECNSTIVATASLYQPRPHDDCDWYNQSFVWHFGQFGVEPALQRHGIGKRLMQIVERRAQDAGAQELACDTAEPALHLRRWYESMGYRFIQHVQWPEVNYRSVILSKTL